MNNPTWLEAASLTLIKYHVTPKSSNRKTGSLVVTTTGKPSCWDGCPLKNNGCYADAQPLRGHWDLVTDTERGTDFPTFLLNLRAALKKSQHGHWRHNQAGDLPGLGALINPIGLEAIAAVSRAEHKTGFTYTHKPVDADAVNITANERIAARANLAALKLNATRGGLVVNLSANNPAHADKLIETGLPICVTVPPDTGEITFTPKGHKVVICPAQSRDDVTCATCRLCSNSDRSVIVGFRIHGNSVKRATAATVNFPAA